MCGIAGWVDYRRDLSEQGHVATEMAATMRLRGPDDDGLFVSPHAVFGHRRLAITDLAGGSQPMTVADGDRTLAAIAYSGEVYNFQDLRQELCARGHLFLTASDTEVVLRAYLEWGERVADRLRGMFAFAVWDARTESLLLVRDHTGVKPLFYWPTASGLLFGSEPKAILAHPMASAMLDADGLREMLAFVKTPGHAFFHGMHELLPGSVLLLNHTGLHHRTYWRLEAAEHSDDMATTVATVRDLLEQIIAEQMIADVPLCTLLSGGLDSSAITALAAQDLRARGHEPVRSFTVDFVGHTEHFQPDSVREAPDGPFAEEVACHLDIRNEVVMLDHGALAEPALRAAAVRARDLPVGALDEDASLYLLFRAVRESSTVALSGEGADEVFGGYAWFHDAQVRRMDTFPWHAAVELRGRADTATALLAADLRAQLDIPTHQRDRYHQALAKAPRLAGETGLEARMRQLSYLGLTRILQAHLDRKDRMSMANGLEVRVPFCDHRLVQYAFNVPWQMKILDGREKSLLRAAVADLLPTSVVMRKKAHYPAPQDASYRRELCHQLAGLLDDEGSPIRPLLDLPAARALAADPDLAAAEPALRDTLETVLTLNSWLEDRPIRLRLEG